MAEGIIIFLISLLSMYPSTNLPITDIEFAKEEPLTSRTAEEWFEVGLGRIEIGDYNGATTAYNNAIRRDPDYAEAYNNRGIAYSAQQQYDQAIRDFTRSIELNNPELHFAYVNRGQAYADLRQYQQAIA